MVVCTVAVPRKVVAAFVFQEERTITLSVLAEGEKHQRYALGPKSTRRARRSYTLTYRDTSYDVCQAKKNSCSAISTSHFGEDDCTVQLAEVEEYLL